MRVSKASASQRVHLLHLIKPLREDARGRDDKDAARAESGIEDCAEERDSLNRLAEAHVIAENAAALLLEEGPQELHV